MPYLIPSYDPGIVAASLLIASFAAYVTLDLAQRVRATDLAVARAWWIGGSITMGTGIWSMHFVGMLAYSLPVPLGYSGLLTLLSWVAGVGASAVALWLASRGRLTLPRLAGGALLMGAGICTMHYTGMAALDMAPPIVWRWSLVAASGAIAFGASAAALLIFFWLRRFGEHGDKRYQAVAALVMGAAISGMHYTGMAAAQFPVGTVCLSSGGLGGEQLGTLVILASTVLLGLTLFTSMLDARMQSTSARLTASLQSANSQLQAANEELQQRAFVDNLTGLPNRLLFEDRLKHALARHARSGRGERMAVLFVDLDGFKPVNDSFGHAVGDSVLQQVAERLQAAARGSDTVARIGGDEFVLLLEDMTDAGDATSLARRVVLALSRPMLVAERTLHVSASVGIALHPDHGEGGKLLTHADAAMYAAKRAGGNSYALFEAHMDAGAAKQLGLQFDLRQAVAGGQLSLHYQPKFDSRRARLSGVEALLRWQHPLLGNIPPNQFIPLAERSGLINELGNWVIDEACRQMQAWQHEGVRLRVAINLSVHQLRQEDLVSRIEQALQRQEVDASMLLCEITESAAMEDIKTTQQAFEGLSRIGVFLSIDDFGTGYSSLSYLRQLPARQLKIDRSFIHDLETSADARAVVDAVVRLAHALGLSVVAEGVETQGQCSILLQLDCDELQGFLFARPMPADELFAWASGQKPDAAIGFSPSVFSGLDPSPKADSGSG